MRAPTILLTVPLALVLATVPAHAQGTSTSGPTMTLGSVLEVAVRQSPSLELAAIDVAIADAAVLEAAGLDDWTVLANAQLQRVRTDLVNPITGDSQKTNLDSYDFSGSLSRTLSTGARVGINAATSRDESPFSLTSSNWTHSLLGSINQPLLRGRGSRIARSARRQARLGLTAAELDRQAAAIGVLRDVITAYWELVYAVRDLEIRRGSLDLANERLRITRASIDAGATAPTEALAVEQIIATREEEIVSAELLVLERSLVLRRIAGMEIGPSDLSLTPAAPLNVVPEPLELSSLLGEAYATSPEIAALAAREKNAAITVELTDNGMLPRLDASLSAGPSGSNTTFLTAGEDLVKLEGFVVRGGLSYEHTLGNRAARASDRRARARLTQAKITMADARQQIAQAMARLVARAKAAEKRMELSNKAIELAEKNVEAEKTRFDLGRATNFDIAQRQEELKLAQLRYARASVDYLDTVAEIDAISGRLPGKYGVKLDADQAP